MNAASAHATALRLASKVGIGIPVTFTAPSAGTEDADGHQTPGASTSITGFLVQADDAKPSESFERLKLTIAHATRYQFVPQTLNQMPVPNSRAVLPHGRFTLHSSDPFRVGANAEAPYSDVVLV